MSSPNRFGDSSVKAQVTAPCNLKGEAGKRFINNTSAQTAPTTIGFWTAIVCKSDCVFTQLTDTSNDGDSMDAITMKQGESLFGRFTNITLASGSIIAYI